VGSRLLNTNESVVQSQVRTMKRAAGRSRRAGHHVYRGRLGPYCMYGTVQKARPFRLLWLHSHLPQARLPPNSNISRHSSPYSSCAQLSVSPPVSSLSIAATTPYAIAFHCDSHRRVNFSLETCVLGPGIETSLSMGIAAAPDPVLTDTHVKYPSFRTPHAVHWTHLSDVAHVNVNAWK
jgi:hypothetical protein